MTRKWFGFLLGSIVLLAVLALPIGMVFAGDNNIHWAELGHNSRDPLFRSPQGAVPTGTAVRLRLRALDGDLTGAQVRVWNDRTNVSTLYNMTLAASGVTFEGQDSPAFEFWEVTLPPSLEPTIYWYRFIAMDGIETAYYEDDANLTGGWGQAFDGNPDYSWQLTYYDPEFTTPEWVQNAIIYQIFPDRFRDGDSTNNPTEGEFFYGDQPIDTTIVRSNTSNWNTAICDPRAVTGAVAACPNKYSQNFYGGDLQGIIDKLDYIDNLGVTAIYLNPIFESPSNHRYDTYDFMQIDSSLGDLALFQTLVTEAHARGINIILDGVFNHTSSDSIYFDRYGRYPVVGACESASSTYRSWYYFTGTGVCDGMDYVSWFGFDSLPKLNADTPAVRDYFINNGTSSVAPYWMQWADGWRLDVGGDIDQGQINDPFDDYWEAFRAAVHAVNPDAYIVGEEWGNATSWVVGGEWDATMNYQFSSAVLGLWRDEPFTDNDHNTGSSAGVLNPLSPSEFNERILNWQERYPREAYLAMMNLTGSHDTNRTVFMLDHNVDLNNTALYANPSYDWSGAILRNRGVQLIQLTMPGAPTIYYGDEVHAVNPPSFAGGRWEDDPYNRVPYPWLDESGTPYYTYMQNQLFLDASADYVGELASTRNAHPALRTGDYIPVLLDDEGGRFAYIRHMPDDSDAAVVAINRGSTAQDIVIDVSGYLPAGATLTEVIFDQNYVVSPTGTITIPNLGNYFGVLLVLDSGFAGTRPASITDLAATPAGNQVTLDWSDAANATSYKVYRSLISDGAYHLIAEPTESTYVDNDVANSVRYYYVVVGVNDTTLLESDWSNQIAAIPAYDLSTAWYNLQWPPTINWVKSAINPTDTVYGQIYIGGVTDTQNTPVDGVRAQVGFGPQSDHPASSTWTWYEMSPNDGYDFGQNNDEYQGTMLPSDADAGIYYYTTRWSADNGATWYYTDLNGPPYAGADAGVLTITLPTDDIPPAAPTGLEVTGTTSVSISLAWDEHPDTDGDLYGFEIWRELSMGLADRTEGVVSEAIFNKIATITDPDATSYTDSSVESNRNYTYYITAIDTSTNRSEPSNTVFASAIMRTVNVTLYVTVPAGTPGPVFVAGDFPSPYPQWNPGGIMLGQVDATHWQVTLPLPDGATIQFKFARGDWERVEKGANYEEIDNRILNVDYGQDGNQFVELTVLSWRDPYVIGVTPEIGAIGVGSDTVITATWSQPMNPASVTDPAGWIVASSGGAVTGTITYDDANRTATFTPDSPLADGTYSVTISGRQAAVDGGNQRVPVEWAFTVGAEVEQIVNDPSFNVLVGADPNGAWAVYAIPDGSLIYGQMGGVFEFYRLPDSIQGVVFQQTGYVAPADTGFDISVELGNTSNIPQRVAVIVHDADWTDLQFCTFWLDPIQPLQPYQMRTYNPQSWENVTISIYASTTSNQGFIQIDNAMVTPRPEVNYNETLCVDPNAPAPTGTPSSENMLVNGGFNEPFAETPETGWVFYNEISAVIDNGFLLMYRTGTPAGSVFQNTDDAVAANTPLEVSFRVSNGSPFRQRVTVIAHAADWSNLGACTFWIDGMTPLTTVVMRTYNTAAWGAAALSFYPQPEQAEDQGSIAIDDVVYRQIPDKSVAGTECYGVGSTIPAQIEPELIALREGDATLTAPAPVTVAPAPAGVPAEQPVIAPFAPVPESAGDEGTIGE